MPKKPNQIKALDLFCGVGGFSLGFENGGIDSVTGFDLDERNVRQYESNFGKGKAFACDLSTATGISLLASAQLALGAVDILFGGPPCQGFSQIGKREKEDPRNSLLHHFGRLIGECLPRYFVVENVEGLLRGEARLFLARFLRKVRDAGYKVRCPIRVLDARLYGVPQSRRRVFVLGCKKDLPLPHYPKPTRRRPSVWDAISDLNVNLANPEQNIFRGALAKPSAYARRLRHDDPSVKELSGFKRTVHSAETIERFRKTSPGDVECVSRFFRLKRDGVCNTLRAGTDNSRGSYTAARPIHPTRHRCITVREAARLHSYPDWFQFNPTIWHGFRQIGNSVPPLLAEAVARQLLLVI